MHAGGAPDSIATHYKEKRVVGINRGKNSSSLIVGTGEKVAKSVHCGEPKLPNQVAGIHPAAFLMIELS